MPPLDLPCPCPMSKCNLLFLKHQVLYVIQNLASINMLKPSGSCPNWSPISQIITNNRRAEEPSDHTGQVIV